MLILAIPGQFKIFQKWVPSENQRYLENGAPNLQYSDLAQGVKVKRLHDGTIFGGVQQQLRAPPIDLFDQESVHRCGLGCSTYPGLDCWISN